jgi:hypothetical protein
MNGDNFKLMHYRRTGKQAKHHLYVHPAQLTPAFVP